MQIYNSVPFLVHFPGTLIAVAINIMLLQLLLVSIATKGANDSATKAGTTTSMKSNHMIKIHIRFCLNTIMQKHLHFRLHPFHDNEKIFQT